MTGAGPVLISAPETHALRRRVLRGADPTVDVRFDLDVVELAFHLGVRAETGELEAVATFGPAPLPPPITVTATFPWQLRGMAVAPERQGHRLGTLLLADGVARVRAQGGDVLWANARDTALGFYRQAGWTTVGDTFMTDIGVPHTLAVIVLGDQ